jgi:23S rRNA (uracil1939-C5)-methyltransferase
MSKKLPPRFAVKIEKLIFSGEGIGRYENRPVFVMGALPGETVLVRPLKKNRHGIKAAIIEITEPAPGRRPAREGHYLSCSPWQVIPEETQRRYKRDAVIDLFARASGAKPAIDPEIVASEKPWHYRNKMEFSFFAGKNGDLSLAFHQRGRWGEYCALEDCALAHERINEVARNIIEVLRARGVKTAALKNLVLRYSYFEDKCLAALFVVDRDFKIFDLEIPDLAGTKIIYSDPRTPAAVATAVLHEQGRDCLTEEILGIKLKYHTDSFFQINPPAFADLLRYIRGYVAASDCLVDLYSGVGTIGYCLSDVFARVVSVESDLPAVAAARDNLLTNKLENVILLEGAAEKQDLPALLAAAGTIIVDPPRSGLHPRVIREILRAVPEQFIYVSCNPATQARDFALLKEKYRIRHWRLFDLYPQTPHVESVIIAERKKWWKIF